MSKRSLLRARRRRAGGKHFRHKQAEDRAFMAMTNNWSSFARLGLSRSILPLGLLGLGSILSEPGLFGPSLGSLLFGRPKEPPVNLVEADDFETLLSNFGK